MTEQVNNLGRRTLLAASIAWLALICETHEEQIVLRVSFFYSKGAPHEITCGIDTMNWSLTFFANSILLGIGLAMDAFSVSCANGLAEPAMGKPRMALMAGTYGFFQFAMPMIGWICVHTIAEKFKAFQKWIPWIALVLLLYIGGEMLLEGIRAAKEKKNTGSKTESSVSDAGANADCCETACASAKENIPAREMRLPAGKLLIQGIATSIDALSVGFTIADYNTAMALVASAIIAVVTFAICMGGLAIGKKFGTKLESKASVLGGIILIAIGLEIWLKGIL